MTSCIPAETPSPGSSDALLRMALAGGPHKPMHALLYHFNSAEAALDAGASAWRATGCTPTQCQLLSQPDHDAFARAQAWLQQPGHHLLGCSDPDYPQLLRTRPYPALAMFIDGDPTALWQPGIAIVGSRSPSAGGRDHAREFAHALASSGLTIASGLAAGVDAAAHRAALACSGNTFAVIGTGPDITYPRHHRELQQLVAGRGAVVSE